MSRANGKEEPSQLDQLLELSRQQGKLESQGQFTMDRDKALAKLAKFQLPFATAWVLKIVQAIVATKETDLIQVDLNWKETRFTFQVDSWSLDDIEIDFFKVDEDRDSPYADLARGLWPVALGDHRTFSLSLPGQLDALLWDGDNLRRIELKQMPKNAVLSVALFPPSKSKADEVKALARYAARNEELLESFKKHCFTCPIPLKVDYERVDILHRCPEFGVGESSMPLLMGCASCDVPSLPIPEGSHDVAVQKRTVGKAVRGFFSTRHDEFGVEKFSPKFLDGFQFGQEATVPYILSFRMKYSKMGGWSQKPGRSLLHWVKHGVVVDTDFLNDMGTFCSLGSYINGNDLPTDLTGLRLRKTDLRLDMANKVRWCLYEHLVKSSPSHSVFESLLGKSKKGKVVGTVGATLGLLTFFIVPAAGIPLMALGGGLWGGDYRNKKKVLRLSQELSHLAESLRPLTPRHLWAEDQSTPL